MKRNVNARLQMPVNVAMQEPWAGVVRRESERDIVSGASNAHDIAAHRISVVVRRASRNAYDVKRVSMEMERMLRRVV